MEARFVLEYHLKRSRALSRQDEPNLSLNLSCSNHVKSFRNVLQSTEAGPAGQGGRLVIPNVVTETLPELESVTHQPLSEADRSARVTRSKREPASFGDVHPRCPQLSNPESHSEPTRIDARSSLLRFLDSKVHSNLLWLPLMKIRISPWNRDRRLITNAQDPKCLTKEPTLKSSQSSVLATIPFPDWTPFLCARSLGPALVGSSLPDGTKRFQEEILESAVQYK